MVSSTDELRVESDELSDFPRAFVVVDQSRTTTVVDLPANSKFVVSATPNANLVLDESSQDSRCTLEWDGESVTLEHDGGTAFVNGKRFSGRAELKPGDEVTLGTARLVLGVSVPLTAGGRRALTHHEFRERMYEEVARAARGNRPTAVVMVQAKSGEGGHLTATALNTFRAGDVVATYAPDEPEFLLPDTPIEEAHAVVKRILETAGTEAAIGIAVAPNDGTNPERLLRASRDALHEALRQNTSVSYSTNPRTPQQDLPEAHDPTSIALSEQVKQLAREDTWLIFVGEMSSGKGLFARLLHQESGRHPFVVSACASITTPTEAARQFGPEGAANHARGGTLLLDEVGDLPSFAQEHLLSFLERSAAELRVVSTTHRALAGLVERGAFNSTLYRMLAGQVLDVPSLRARPEDIIPLATHFAKRTGANHVRFSAGAIARLRSYPWPGNVLELRNAMDRAARLGRDGEILAEHLPNDPMPIASGAGRLREHVDSVERDAIIKALADSNHNQTHSARRLGISRRALIYKMEKYGLKRPPRTAKKQAPAD